MKVPAAKESEKSKLDPRTLDRIGKIIEEAVGKAGKIPMTSLGNKLRSDSSEFKYDRKQHGALEKFLATYPDRFEIDKSSGKPYVKLK